MVRKYFSYKRIGSEKGQILKYRKLGYYWVQYSYGGTRQWRIGFYNPEFGFWHLDGDPRPFFDCDLLQISERQIPRYWVIGITSRRVLYLLIAFSVVILTSVVIDIYNLVNLITK